MNYGYLTQEAFDLKLSEMLLVGGVSEQYMRDRYREDFVRHVGPKESQIISIFPGDDDGLILLDEQIDICEQTLKGGQRWFSHLEGKYEQDIPEGIAEWD